MIHVYVAADPSTFRPLVVARYTAETRDQLGSAVRDIRQARQTALVLLPACLSEGPRQWAAYLNGSALAGCFHDSIAAAVALGYAAAKAHALAARRN